MVERKEEEGVHCTLLHRKSCVSAEVAEREEEEGEEESVLGRIHLDLARYHEACRLPLIPLLSMWLKTGRC